MLTRVFAALIVLALFEFVPIGAQSPARNNAIPSTIPIFPLQDIMLFPGASRPLHIFEERYREMVADALESDRVIGMVMLRPGYEDDYEGNPPVYDIGCAGVIVNVERLPEGQYNIVLQGLSRFRITREDHRKPYRIAEVDPLFDSINDNDRRILREHRSLLLELLSFVAPDQRPTPEELPDDLLVNGLAQFLGMAPVNRLDLLQQDGPLARAEALMTLLDQGLLSR